MYSVDGTKITLTRGDTFAATLALTQAGEPYTPVEGDSIKFGIKKALNVSRTAYINPEPLLEKAIPITDMTLRLAPRDTEPLPFGSYFYDIEVTLANGTVDTVINNAIFLLVPEVI